MPRRDQSFTQEYDFPQETWFEILKPINNRKTANYLELGVYEGRSFLWVAENILPASSRLDAVDHFYAADGMFERFSHNVEYLREKHDVRVLRGRVEEVLPSLTAHDYDLIYVDADHSYQQVWNNIVLAWPLLKTGGFMVMDDYFWLKYLLPSAQRPERAIEDFLRLSGMSCRLLFKDVQVFVQKTGELPKSLKVIESESPQIPKSNFTLPRKFAELILDVIYYYCGVRRRVYLALGLIRKSL